MTVFAAEQVAEHPDAIALCDERCALTWAELANAVARGANALLAMHLPQPLRVAVYANNSVETAIAYLAALRVGASSVPVNFHLTADETAYILEDSDASVVFAGPETIERGLAAAAQAGVTHVIGWRSSHPEARSFESWLAGASAAEPPAQMRALPHLHYTSGTTGRPKGVETPPNMFPIGASVAAAFAAFEAEVKSLGFEGPSLAVSPLYHTSPLRAVRLLAGGAPLVSMEKFDAEATVAAIERHRVSNINMTPTHFVRLLALPESMRAKYDLSSLKRIRHTGAACPVHVKRALIEWLGPIVVEVYGATESGPATQITSQEWLDRPGSVGRCLEPFEVEVWSEDGVRLGPNQTGVLYFRDKSGRGIAYHNDPEKAARAHRAPGVFTLGEIGHVDEEGFVYVTDRISDMVISGGVNIYPAEIEHALLEHPAIHDVAVIGVPNEEMGEEVLAVIALEPGAAPPAQTDLDAFCRARLAGYKRPRSYRFVEDIGRNPLGKVNKRALRDAILAPSPA